MAFDGYCPVSMRLDVEAGALRMCDTAPYIAAAPLVCRAKGTAAVLAYRMISGAPLNLDPAIDHQQQVPGKRDHSLDYDGLFYLFASEATLQQFTANPGNYASGTARRWAFCHEAGCALRTCLRNGCHCGVPAQWVGQCVPRSGYRP